MVMPWIERKANLMELISEILLLWCFFGLIFCETESNPFTKLSMGWFSVVSVAVLVLMHLLNMGFLTITNLLKDASMYLKKRKDKKAKEAAEKEKAKKKANAFGDD